MDTDPSGPSYRARRASFLSFSVFINYLSTIYFSINYYNPHNFFLKTNYTIHIINKTNKYIKMNLHIYMSRIGKKKKKNQPGPNLTHANKTLEPDLTHQHTKNQAKALC